VDEEPATVEASEGSGLPPGYDEEALALCREIFWGLVEDPEKVKLTITSEFRDTVRELIEDKEYAASYEQDRPQAFALAKTIPISGDTQHVVVFSEVLRDGRPYGPPEATFEHEALHVLIAQHGESLYDLRQRGAVGEVDVQGDLLGMAGVACEEYRVERVLAAAGHESRSLHSAGFEEAARRLYREAEAGVRRYAQDGDLRALAGAVLNGFHALATASAYLAAELAAEGTGAMDIAFPEEVENLMLGEPWREVIVALMELPAAAEPTEPAELEALAFTLGALLGEWLEYFGFEVVDRDGMTNFTILAPRQWHLDAGL
jgi:hypothetical protein